MGRIMINLGKLQSLHFQTDTWKSKIFSSFHEQNFGTYILNAPVVRQHMFRTIGGLVTHDTPI